jgi:hypothetical protein
MEFANRVSTFIVVMGVSLIALFGLSVAAKETKIILLVVGLVLLALAAFLNYRFPTKQEPRAERFRLLKKNTPKVSAPPPAPAGRAVDGRKNQHGNSGKRGNKKQSGRQEKNG